MASSVIIEFLSAYDRDKLQNALRGSEWAIESVDTLQQALQRSTCGGISAAICETVLPDGHSWIDLLNELAVIPHPPPLVIAARGGDSRLWAEVLNLGGWDVVATSFAGTDCSTYSTQSGSHRPELCSMPRPTSLETAESRGSAMRVCVITGSSTDCDGAAAMTLQR